MNSVVETDLGHDPTALVCMLHPEVDSWVRGGPTRMKGGWTTVRDEEGDLILVDLDRNLLWQYLLQLN